MSGSVSSDTPPQRPEVKVTPDNGVWRPPVQPSPSYPGRNTNQLSILRNTILPAMWRHKYAWPFHYPVDTVKLGLPDYFEIIKEPMDMLTIKERLDNNFYWKAQDCIEDFNKMLTNIYIYKKPGEEIVVMAKNLERFFIGKLQSLPTEESEIEVSPPQKVKSGQSKGSCPRLKQITLSSHFTWSDEEDSPIPMSYDEMKQVFRQIDPGYYYDG